MPASLSDDHLIDMASEVRQVTSLADLDAWAADMAPFAKENPHLNWDYVRRAWACRKRELTQGATP